MGKQSYRYLRGYTLDPGFSTQIDTFGINETVYRIQWEDELKPGPLGEYFDVIDVDPPSQCFYEPVDLNAAEVLARQGLSPSEGNPQFHQQLVYTVAMKTLEHFEKALGRKIIWRPVEIMDEKGHVTDSQYQQHLRIYPHAMREANAYYDPDKKALLFGYFRASNQINGVNFPGGVVFTCLSPDIVAHEMTHAILDSIHPRFIENTNPDVAAFHEGFADIVSLLQRFSLQELLEHQLTRAQGKLDRFTVMGELATQFGNALGDGHGALRSAIGGIREGYWQKMEPNPAAYRTIFEPHARGAILVAAVFDAFLRLYAFKTKDLFLISGVPTDVASNDTLHPDLIKRLAREASETSQQLLHICIRALDYCPPLDITYGDYLRALVTADLDMAPSDELGFRIALIESFRAWGIFPDRVNTLSVESLRWGPPDFTSGQQNLLNDIGSNIRAWIRPLLDEKDRKEIHHQTQHIQALLHDYLMNIIYDLQKEDPNTTSYMDRVNLLENLGLTIAKPAFMYENRRLASAEVPPLEVHSIRPSFSYTREGLRLEQVVIKITQSIRIKDEEMGAVKFRGGCTIILNMRNDYEIGYVIVKNVQSESRFMRQLDFQRGLTGRDPAFTQSTYLDENVGNMINFKQLHQHSPH